MQAVAAIIPAHNAAPTIGETLRAALAQTFPPAEIIVVDDGSTDGTATLVAGIAAQHPQVRLLRQQCLGPSAARNRAIAATQAPLIAPLDADDVWAPQYLAHCAAALSRQPQAGFAYAWHHLVDAQGRAIRGPLELALEGDILWPMALVNCVGNGSSAVFRRAAMVEAGLYRAPLPDWPGAEDYLLQLRVAARRPVVCVPRDLVAYRKGPHSLSANADGAYRARRAAVRIIAAEAGPPPASLLRWVAGDASRVHAVTLLCQRRRAGAAGMAIRALAADPAGTLFDFALRCRNRIWHQSGGHRLDPLLRARLLRLANGAAPGGLLPPPFPPPQRLQGEVVDQIEPQAQQPPRQIDPAA
jgi:glycosyltransferase involved in cell wall biosynthesis